MGEVSVGGREIDIRKDTVRDREMVDVVLRAIGDNPGSILDVGTGNGEVARKLKEEVPGGKVFALDLKDSRDVKKGDVPAFLVGQGEHLPFADKAIDWVVFNFTLHHAEAPEDLLKEGMRVAKKGVLIVENDVSGWRVIPTALIDQAEPILKRSPLCRNFNSEAKWLAMAKGIIGQYEEAKADIVHRFTLVNGFWKNVVIRIDKNEVGDQNP